MTINNMLSQIGLAPKHYTERFQNPHINAGPAMGYSYQQRQEHYDNPSSISKSHHGHSSGHKNNAAMSALTLLAFLFFLNILQQCLKEHMTSMTTTPIMVVSATREGEELNVAKRTNPEKVDKSGVVSDTSKHGKINKSSNKEHTAVGNVTNAHNKDNINKFTRVTNENSKIVHISKGKNPQNSVSRNEIFTRKVSPKESSVAKVNSGEVKQVERPYTKVQLSIRKASENSNHLDRKSHHGSWYRDGLLETNEEQHEDSEYVRAMI